MKTKLTFLLSLTFLFVFSCSVYWDDFQDAFGARNNQLVAEQRNANAQFNLGVMYEDGEGVEQDYMQAVKWWKLGADQGDAGAQNNLGIMCENGLGVEQDYKEAVKWYRKAAAQGNKQAQKELNNLLKQNPQLRKE